MPSRAELNVRAAAVGFDSSTIPNDSKLEQKILYIEKRQTTITGTAPTTTLTTTGTASDGETITLGTRVYTLKTALTEAAATGTITSTGTIPNDGDTVGIGNRTYIFKTALDTGSALVQLTSAGPAVVEVLINASAANALTNLKRAILNNGTSGTDYTTNNAVHPQVTATTLTSTTLLVVDRQPGTDAYKGYTVATTVSKTASTLSWAAAALTGGANPVLNQILIGAAATNTLDNIKDTINGTSVSGGPGSTYATGTLRNTDLTAGAKTTTTLVIASTDTNDAGGTASTETMANASFTGAAMSAGTAGTITPANNGTNNTLGGVAGDRNTTL